MGKASSSKKVARAASTGGGRTSRGKAPVLWYSALAVIVIAGIGLVTFSRQERQDALGSAGSSVPPRYKPQDHWHVAYGVYVCDHWLDPATDQNDPKGIHTHGDGIIHVHPSSATSAGTKATFARFVEALGAKVSANGFTWPSGAKEETHTKGQKCGTGDAAKPGEVQAYLNGVIHKGDPRDMTYADMGVLVMAFVPEGTTYAQIGDPPSKAGLANLEDVPATTTTSVPDATTPGSDPSASTTTSPGSPTTAATTGSTAAPSTTVASTSTTAKP